MRIIFTIATLIVHLSFNPFYLYSSDRKTNKKPVLNLTRIDKPIKLSGKLDDPVWQSAEPIQLNYEVEPGENTKPPQKTIAMALFNNDYLYIGFRCYDTNPNEIRANLTDRDKIYSDDNVLVFIDTYGDNQKAYELAVNPFGIQADAMKTLNNEDDSFNMLWLSSAARNDSGWTAELAIPFKNLRYPNKEDQEWSIILARVYPRNSRVIISWTPLDRNNPSILSQAGILKGLKNIESGSTLEILPYVIGQQSGNLKDENNPGSGFSNNPIFGRIGGGIKYSPGTNFSLDAVVNPDFSQVESDAEQISINTTFALFYSEKRPFFLEGQEHLQTPMYYSRSINNPLAAARILGKSGSLTYMYINAFDRNTPFVIPGEEESNTISSSLKSFSNIGRLRYDFGNENYIGAMLMTKNFSEAHNYLIGFDWSYKFWNNWFFTGEGFISHTKEINNPNLLETDRKFGSTSYTASFDGEKYYGDGIHLVLSHSDREYNLTIVYNDFSPTYQTYNGFFPLTNYRQLNMSHGYSIYPENSIFDKIQFTLDGDLQFNQRGIKKEQYIIPSVNLTFKGQNRLNISYLLVNDERFRTVYFNGIHRLLFNYNSEPINELSLSFNGEVGKFIYRAELPKMGKGHNISAVITLRPSSRFKIDLSYSRAGLSDESSNELFYDGYILRTVASYQFTPEIFLRSIFQYDSFGKSFNIYPLFNYKLNAFTTFYAGVTNNYLDFGEEYGLTTTVRQYFVKLQYLLSI